MAARRLSSSAITTPHLLQALGDAVHCLLEDCVR